MLPLKDARFPHRYPLVSFPRLDQLRDALFEGKEVTLSVKVKFNPFELTQGVQLDATSPEEQLVQIRQIVEQAQQEEVTSRIEREMLGGADSLELTSIVVSMSRDDVLQEDCDWAFEGKGTIEANAGGAQKIHFRALFSPQRGWVSPSIEIATNVSLV